MKPWKKVSWSALIFPMLFRCLRTISYKQSYNQHNYLLFMSCSFCPHSLLRTTFVWEEGLQLKSYSNLEHA